MQDLSTPGRKLPGNQRIRRSPTAKEIADLVFTAGIELSTLDARDVLSIIANTGIRSSELRSLRWEDVNFDQRFMLVRAGHGKRVRRVPFGKNVLNVLQLRHERERSSDFVFGKSPRQVIERASRQCRSLSVGICANQVTLQGLRLSFFKRWVDSGASIQALGLISGGVYVSRKRGQDSLKDYEIAALCQADLEV
jgi:integrase